MNDTKNNTNFVALGNSINTELKEIADELCGSVFTSQLVDELMTVQRNFDNVFQWTLKVADGEEPLEDVVLFEQEQTLEDVLAEISHASECTEPHFRNLHEKLDNIRYLIESEFWGQFSDIVGERD